MKTKSIIALVSIFIFTEIVTSCKKDGEGYTLENQLVTGDFSYVTTSFVPIDVDPVTQQPISANITMTGQGTLTDLGEISMVTSFKFDFVTGQGSDFVSTYTGTSPSDNFSATGSSQRQQDGSIIVTETFTNGKGKFEKIKGGGQTTVLLSQDGSGGTGTANWTVTY